ncbi:hypothetical protein [Geodermatophilus sp. SYSU D00815]
MARRLVAALALLVAVLVQAALLPAAVGTGSPGTWAAWALVVGGGVVAGLLAARGDRRSWGRAGALATGLLALVLLVHVGGLPGRPARPWDPLAGVSVAAAAVAGLLWLGRRRDGGRALALRAGAVAAAALVVAVLVPFGGAPSNAGAPGPAGHEHAGHEPSGPARPAVPPLAAATLEEQLAAARAAATRWPTLADARADGWTLADDYIPRIGSHWMRYDRIDAVFDPAEPEMLMFAGDQPGAVLVGLTYYVVHQPPTGFAGDQDVWHQHRDVCIGPDGPLFAGDGVGVCRSPWDWSWMLHAWVVPGHENPDGVFATENPLV